MQIYSWSGDHPNFGDDLNHFLWSFLMPEVVATDDGALLIGVGTVLYDKLPAAAPRVVMGSGVGYSPAPRDIKGPGWAVYAVRGPLTARLLDLAPDRAVVDPAVLLPAMPDWSGTAHGDPIFVPHWTTALDADWRPAAERAGLRWVDPRGDPHTVIRAIAGASLVVAESMHGAIIADAFRMPWVPVVGTHRSVFKWSDWAGSLGMDYAPRPVGLLARLQARLAPNPRFTGARPAAAADGAVPPRRRPADLVRDAIGKLPAPLRQGLIARDLAAAKRSSHRRSTDRALASRQALLQERIDQLRADYAAGRIVPGLEPRR